jgi:hypothetical protein
MDLIKINPKCVTPQKYLLNSLKEDYDKKNRKINPDKVVDIEQ